MNSAPRWWTKTLSKLFAGSFRPEKSPRGPVRRPPVRLRVDRLEDRLAPAATITSTAASLTISLSTAAETAVVNISGGAYTITDTAGVSGTGGSVSGNTFTCTSTASGQTSFTIPAGSLGIVSLATPLTSATSVTVGDGTLTQTVVNALPATAAVTVGDTSGDLALLSLNNLNLTVGQLTYYAPASGPTTMTNLGSGQLTLNGSLSMINNTSAPGNAYEMVIAGTGPLDLGGGIRAFNCAGQNNILNYDMQIAVPVQDGGIIFTGTPSSSVGDATSMELENAADSFAQGLQINEGTVAATVTGAMPAASPLIMGFTGTGTADAFARFDMIGVGQTVAGISMVSGGTAAYNSVTSTSGTPTLTIGGGAGSYSYGGLIGAGLYQYPNNTPSSAMSLVKFGTSTQALTNAANPYTGGTMVSGGILDISADGALGPTAGPLTLNGGTLQFAAAGGVDLSAVRSVVLGASGGTIDTNGGNDTIDSAISGAASTDSLAKVGAGILTLTGNETYAGGTTVSAGELDDNGSITSAATVSGTGILAGNGSTGAIAATSGVVNPGSPASGIGILAASSADFSGGGKLTLQIAGTTTPGTDYDQFDLSGALTLGGTSAITLDLAGLTGSPPTPINNIITYASETGSFTTVNTINNPNGYTPTLTYTATGVDIRFVAVATHFLITGFPASTAAGTALTCTVAAVDGNNNVVPTYTGTVHFTTSDPSLAAVVPPNFTFVAADNGVETFTLQTTFVTAGNQTLTATDISTALTGTSAAVLVTSGSGRRLVVTTQPPTTATAGVAFSVAPVVALEDQYGNIQTSDSTDTVTVTRGPVGTATLQGTPLTVTLINGSAIFGGLFYYKAETIDLSFTTSAGSYTATSNNVVVNPNVVTQLLFAQQPTSTTAGTPISPVVTAKLEDTYNNIETTDNASSLSLAINTGPTGGVFASGSTTTAVVSAGVATFTNLVLDTAGNYTLKVTDSSPALSSVPSNPFVISPSTATQLVFGAQPTNAAAGVALNPVVTAKLLDSYGNVETNDNASNLTISIATAPAGGVFASGSTTTVAVSAGVATFTTLKLATAGTYTLHVTDPAPSLTSLPSNSFVISAGGAAQLAFGVQPTNTTAGVAINPQVTVKIEDAFGNVETTDNASTLTVGIASGPTGGAFAGGSTTSATVSAGVATFALLVLQTAGNYTLSASDAAPVLTGLASNSFIVSPGAASNLVFGQQPTNSPAGAALNPAVTVKIEDQYGNVETTDGSSTISMVVSSGPGALTGSITATANAGVATFSNLDLNTAGTYTLRASDAAPVLNTSPSNSFVVSPNSAFKLVFGQQPTNVIAGAALSPVVTAKIEDIYGNLETSDNASSLSIAIASGPAGGVFASGSTTTATVSGGVASFTSLKLDIAGNYTLQVSDSAPTIFSPASNSFTVSPNSTATQLVFGQQPTNATAGVALSPPVTLKLEDAFGNVETNDNASHINIAILTGPTGASFAGGSITQATVVAGVASFSSLILDKAGSYTLDATDASPVLTSASSSSFVISPSAAAQVVFGQQPTTTSAGVAISPAVTAKIEDAFGNVETADGTSSLNIAVASGPGGFAAASTTTAPVSAGVATFSNLILDSVGSYTLQASDAAPLFTSPASSSFQVTPSAAAHLVFGQQPTNVSAGAALNPVVTVKIEDAFGNVDTADSASSLTIAVASGPGAFTGTSTTTATVSAGVATFTTLKLNTAGVYTLQAMDASPALTSAASNSFVVSPAAATQIVFGQQPTYTTAGAAISPPVTAKIEDTYGNVETGDNTSSLSIAIASGPLGGVFAGGSSTSVTVSGGVATFSALKLDTAGAYTLQANDALPSLSSAPSASFVVNPSTASSLIFNQQPTNTTAGVAITPAVTVKIEDAFGNVETNDNLSSLSITVASGPGSLAATSTTSALVSAGVATFGNLVLDTAGSGYTLQAHDAAPALNSAASTSFVVSPNTATQLAFGVQPTNTLAGVPINPPVTVKIEDAYGNVETGDSASSLSIGVASGPAGAAFAGGSTTTATVSAGVATFTALKLDTAGGYSLQATDLAPSLASPTSQSFVVSPNTATQLAFGQQPINTAAGVAIAPAVTVKIEDAFGNVEAADNSSSLSLAIAVGPPGATFAAGSTTSGTASSGVVTFGNLKLDTAGSYALQAADLSPALTSPTSGSFLVTPNVASQLIFTQQPTTTGVGAIINPAVVVKMEDAYNNVESEDNTSSVTLAIASGLAGFSASSTTSVTVNAGVATFSNLAIDTAGTYTIGAVATGGVTGPNSTTFAVLPSPLHLVFGQAPTNTTAGQAVAPVTVRVLDQFNALVTGDNTDQVTLAIVSGPGGFAAGSTTTVTVVGGVATFNSLVFDTAGTYVLSENTPIATGPNSSSFVISAAAADHLGFSVQPGASIAGNALSPGVQVRLLDPFGNLVSTNNTDQVTLAIASGPGAFNAGSTTGATLSGGVANFSNLTLNTAGTYTLRASDTLPVTSALSSSFVVSPSTATQLVFSQQPTSITAGSAINPPVTVTLEDSFGNVETNDNSSTLSIALASGPAGAAFAAGSTTGTTVSAGVATFTTLNLDTAGSYTLQASDSALALTTAVSSVFVVRPGAPTQIVFGQQPTNTLAGAAISPAVTAKIEDLYGNVETADSTTSLTIALASGPGSFAAGSTTTALVSAGIATFTTLKVSTAGNYTLQVSDASPALTSPASASFVVRPNTATQIVFGQQPSNAIAGVLLTPTVTAKIEDAYGNVETSDNASSLSIAIASAPAGGVFASGSTTGVTVSDGVATFTTLKLNTAGSYTLQVSDAAPALTSAPSGTFIISPSGATQLVFGQQPANTLAGAALSPAVTVKIEDSFGNVETADNATSVTVGIASGPAGGVFTGGSTATTTVSAGVATFNNLVLDTTGTYALSEDATGGLFGPNSTSFQVTPATTGIRLAFSQQPSTTVAGVAIGPAVTVRVLDAYNNLLTTDNTDQVTLAIAGGPGGFASGSTTTATVSGGVATFNNLFLDIAGAYTLSESATGGLTGAASISFTVTPAPATHLAFGQQPTNTAAGVAINPGVTVRVLDAFNNLLTTDTSDLVTLSIASGPAGFTGTSTTTATVSAGIATFSNLVLDTAGSYMLQDSTASGLAGAASSGFQVTPVAASQLAFGTQPSTTVAGAAISPGVTVRILDAFGNLVSGDNTDQVTMTIASGPASFAGTSVTTVTANGGIATFSNLVLDTAGSYTLNESATGGLSGPVSTGFVINPAAANHLVFGQQPGATTAGVAINPAVTVRIFDRFNNLVTTDSSDAVTLAITSGPAGFTPTSTATVTASAGIATFSNLSLDTTGVYSLGESTTGGLTGLNSNNFQVTPAAATHLAFVQQPGAATAGVALNPAVTVSLRDAFNNVVTTDNSDVVTLAINSGPGSFTPGSAAAATANNGVATFSNLVLDSAGDYSLYASATGGLVGSASNSFTVTPAAATQLVFGQQPTGATAGIALSPPVTVKIEDPFGNVETLDNASTLSIAITTGPTGAIFAGGSATSATVSSGVATFAALKFDTAGIYALTASDTAPALTSAPSSSFTISPNAATQLIFGQQPTSTSAGVALNPAVNVQIEDQFGNIETNDNASVLSLAIASGPSGGSFAAGSTTSAVVSAGVATFPTLDLDTAGVYTLTASDPAPALASAPSSGFTISPGNATKLAFGQQPSNAAAGAVINPAVTVRILDAFNNVITSDNSDQVTLGVAGGPGPFTAASTVTATASAGIATFSNLAFDASGAYTLTEIATNSLAGPNSNSFQIAAATPSRLVFGVQPSTTVAGVSVNPAVTVRILDQFGNLDSTDSTDQVTLAIASGPGGFAGRGSTTVTASGGIATFSNLVLDTTGSYTISETATGSLAGPASASFLVVPATATHLAFSQQPGATAAGSALSPAVSVRLLDAFNNLVSTDSTDSVSVSIASGPAGFTPGSTTTAIASNGVATFPNLVLTTAGTYALNAIATGGLTGSVSNSFPVNPLAASQLVFGTQPNSSVAGAALNPAVTVRILDSLGNLVSSDNTDQVTLTIASGPAGFTNTSTVKATASGGVATFSNLVLDSTGSYTLGESATGGLNGPASASFLVTPSAATHLAFGQQPTNSVAGVKISPAVSVRVLDAFNNLVTSDNSDLVTLAIASGPAGFTAISTTTVAAASGIATFGNLVLDSAGAYLLGESTSGGLTGLNSSSFQVTPTAATHLAFAQQPGATTAGAAVNPAVIVHVLDAFNNVVTSDNSDAVTLTLSSGPGPFTGSSTTTATASAGVATFNNLVLDTAGSYSLAESATGGLAGPISAGFVVNPGAATQIVFGQQPTNAAAGAALSPMVTAQLEDPFGNVETLDNVSALSVAIASGPVGAVLAGGSTTTATVSSGVATFSSLILDTAGAYTLIVSDQAPALHSAASNSFTINPGAATQLVFNQQPTNTTAGIAAAPALSVKIEDPFGNVETLDNTSALSLAIASGPAGARFAAGSTTSAVVNGGVANFATLILDTAGAYTLAASDLSPALTSAASSTFLVSPGSAAKLAIGQQPGTTVAGAPINPGVAVRILDAFNNLVTTDSTDLVTLAVASGPGSLATTSTATVTASAGIATFTNLALDAAGGYTLSESATGGLVGPDTNSFQVVAAAPSQLVFGVQPSATVAGIAISPAVTVHILDPFGNLVSADHSDSVTLAIASGPGTIAPTSTTTVAASGGIATFGNLTLDTAGSYTLSESATGGIAGPNSSSFVVTPAAATHLAFGQQPTTTTVGAAIAPAVTVRMLDPFNNVVTSDNADAVTLALASGPGGFTAGSTTIATANGGIATFNNLVLNTQSTSDTLLATNGNLGTATSTSFNVRNPVRAITVSSSLNPSIFGQTVTLSVAVTGVGGIPSGAVTVTEGGATLATGLLSGGATTIPLTALNAGQAQSLVVNYVGDTLFAPGSTALLQTVLPATTTTALSPSAASVFGQAVTFTANVAVVSPGAGNLAGGPVTFLDGSIPLGTGIINNSQQATFTTSLLSAGKHTITAVYGPTLNFASSAANAITQSVTPSATTVILAATSPSYYGQPVTFTATLAAATGATVTGFVTFKDGGAVLGTGAVNAQNVATFTTNATQLATNVSPGHSITASYVASNNFLASNATAQTQIVNPVITATNLTASTGGTSVVGQTVTFTATIVPMASGAGTPTGKVTFFDNSKPIGTVPLNFIGQASFTTSTLTLGSHLIEALYSGAANFTGSSNTLTLPVLATTTAITLGSSLSAGSVFGQAVTFTANVAIAAPAVNKVAGTVSFFADGALLGMSSLNAAGQAKFTTSALTGSASHVITAVYNGAATVASSDALLSQSVAAAVTTTTLSTPAVANWAVGQPVFFTAKIASAKGLTSTGAVVFTIDGVDQNPVILSAGAATLNFAGFSTTGVHTVSATFEPDSGNFAGSASAILSKSVFEVDRITLSGPSGTVAAGQSVTISAAVIGAATVPTGSVLFYDGKRLLGTVSLDANGIATITLPGLGAGSHNITAVYMGDSNYAALTSTVLTFGGRLV